MMAYKVGGHRRKNQLKIVKIVRLLRKLKVILVFRVMRAEDYLRNRNNCSKSQTIKNISKDLSSRRKSGWKKDSSTIVTRTLNM